MKKSLCLQKVLQVMVIDMAMEFYWTNFSPTLMYRMVFKMGNDHHYPSLCKKTHEPSRLAFSL